MKRKILREKGLSVLSLILGGLALVLLIGCGEKPVELSADDKNFEKTLKEKLITAKPGTIIKLPAGKFTLSTGLTLTKKGVSIKGEGMNKTILSFKGQKSGAEGLKVTAGDFKIEDIALEDSKGDALKIIGGENITIRRVRVEWTNGPDEKNGAYGLYPVQCKNILIEESVAIGASDAGIYVGQSENIVIRKSTAKLNVAGIEIENSKYADVYDNVATENTGGILVFDLPDLPVAGRHTRVYNNKVENNNTGNFAPSGNIVAKVPAGTGVMILATDEVEVFNNTINDHKTASVLVVSYHITESKWKDKNYDAYPESINIHDNKISKGGYDPTGGAAWQSKKLMAVVRLKIGTPFPAFMHDGILNKKLLVDGKMPEDKRICFQNNGDVTVANLDAANNLANINKDPAAYACSHASLAEVQLALK